MGQPNKYTAEYEGLRFEWIARRSEVDCNVYRGDKLIAELGYPKIYGPNMPAMHDTFKREALQIALEDEKKTA